MRSFFKVLLFIILLVGTVGAFLAYNYYGKVFMKNVQISEDVKHLYISKNARFQQVVDSLEKYNFLKSVDDFIWVAKLKNYPRKVKGGKYLLEESMTNNSLINLLRSGKQVPINLTFNNIRVKRDLADRISEQIDVKSQEILNLLNHNDFISEYGFNSENILSMFIPNTYEFYWSTDARTFFKRMNTEYNKFWNEQRLAKAAQVKLTPIEISILASVVQAEQSKYNDEKPIIAGLYINRLNKGILLQSDPTLVYAIGDFSLKRVLNIHKEVNSPYNTYKYAGLPPGPITLPEISTIDAVLNYEKNDYIFMCAKDDFSGYHYFAKTASQHYAYARRYHAALNKQKIYK